MAAATFRTGEAAEPLAVSLAVLAAPRSVPRGPLTPRRTMKLARHTASRFRVTGRISAPCVVPHVRAVHQPPTGNYFPIPKLV
jgi:hypothetical protein